MDLKSGAARSRKGYIPSCLTKDTCHSEGVFIAFLLEPVAMAQKPQKKRAKDATFWICTACPVVLRKLRYDGGLERRTGHPEPSLCCVFLIAFHCCFIGNFIFQPSKTPTLGVFKTQI